MITTFQALAVAFVALMPGATYTFAYERQAGAYGVNLSDRLVRFLVASAAFHALLSGAEVEIYRKVLLEPGGVADIAWWQIQIAALLYVAIPAAAGYVLGRGVQANKAWAAKIAGTARHPRAWDHLWSGERRCLVRVRLKSDIYLAGIFEPSTDGGVASYASGYGEDGDLFLSRQVRVNPDTGAYELDPDTDLPQAYVPDLGLLLRCSDVDAWHIQLIEAD